MSLDLDRYSKPVPADPRSGPDRAPALAAAIALILSLPSLAQAQEKRGLQKVTTATAEGRIELTVQVQAKAGRLLRTLESGAALRSGDLIQFVLAVDQPAFVYVLQVFADGSAQVLYPEQADVRLQAGLETRLPEAGAWYQLDDVVGEEHLYFLASALPLAEVDQTLYETVEGLRSEQREVAAAVAGKSDPSSSIEPPPPTAVAARQEETPDESRDEEIAAPSPFGLGTRGLVKTVPGATAQVVSDEAGLAIYHFWFEHRPKPELEG